MVNVALDWRPMEEISAPLPVELLGLALAPDGRHVDHLPSSRPLEHSVLEAKRRNDNLNSSNELQFGSDLRQSDLTQAECALCRHLDSLKPETPMSDIVDSCRVWESHRDVETEPRTRSDRRPVHAVCQVAVDEQIRTPLPETESLEDIISKLSPTPAPPKTRKDPILSDRDLLIQRLLGTLAPSSSEPVVQKRSAVTDLETMLLDWLPVGTVKEDTVVPLRASAVSADRCFSCRIWTHMTENCRTLDESFQFLPMGWRAERVGDQFILGPGSPAGPEDHEMGNGDWFGERGWPPGPAMPTDPNPQ